MTSSQRVSARRAALVDALGLLAIALALLDYVRPALLLLPTFTAGGDMVCHYPTLAYLQEQLLPKLRLHGWYAGAYLGQPILLYYFPTPFLVMAALAPAFGLPVAFKLGTALGVFLLPFCAYLGFRWLGFKFPGPLFGALGGFVFLLVEENPIWGGTLPSTLAGEFSYAYGIAFALLFLGLAYRAYARGHSPIGPALLLGATALAHGYAVLWAGLSSAFFLFGARRPLRTLAWLLSVAALSFALVGFWLLPLLWDWGWTTPFNDAWIFIEWKNLLPTILWPWFILAVMGLGVTLLTGRREGGADRRILYLWHAALVGAALAAAGPRLGIIDVRFLPFAQLALTLAGGASLALFLAPLHRIDLAAAGVCLMVLAGADARTTFIRYWSEYNYSGLEAKDLWPAFREMTRRLAGSVGDPRVAVEYSPEHERAGSIRMYETLPFFTGRSTLEGVYNQASLNTHAVYYLTSELCERSPNPFRNVEFATFDTDRALAHLRLFATDTIVAVSPKLTSALDARADVMRIARIRPYSIYRLKEEVRYVEPLRYEPVASSEDDWRAKAQRWFAREPLSAAPLVFSRDPHFGLREPDEWLGPPLLAKGGEPPSVTEALGAEDVRIHTSAVGWPLLVKISWHPRWKAEGALGPFRVSPALMMVIPQQHDVTLRYGPNRVDSFGRSLSALALLLIGLSFARVRRPAAAGERALLPLSIRLALFGEAPPRRRWGGLLPAAVLALLFGVRFVPERPDLARAETARQLAERAQLAQSQRRFGDAAEYAQHAIARTPPGDAKDALRCLRAEALVHEGKPNEARRLFDDVLRESPNGREAVRARTGLASLAGGAP